MVKKIFSIVILASLIAPAHPFSARAITVECTTCSTAMQQVLEYATQLMEYAELVSQTEEMIKQTEMEIKNLKSLGESLFDDPLDWLLDLAHKTNELNTYRGEINVLAQIFNEVWPEQSTFAELAGANRDEIDAANAAYQKHYEEWSQAIDEHTMATFQLSGDQLKAMEDSGELHDYLENLLKKPEGNLQALQAGNSLAAVQIEEIRQLRELAATAAQSEITQQMKAEKQEEAAAAFHNAATKTDILGKGDTNEGEIRIHR